MLEERRQRVDGDAVQPRPSQMSVGSSEQLPVVPPMPAWADERTRAALQNFFLSGWFAGKGSVGGPR